MHAGIMALSGGGGGTDPYFADVVSLNHFDGVGSPTTFPDVIPDRSWTRTGTGIVISSTQAKFGGGSLFTDNNGNYLTSDSTSDFAFGTDDFTLELWVYPVFGSSVGFYFVADWRSSMSEAKPCIYINNLAPVYYVLGAARITSSIGLTEGAWAHVAISRVSGTTRMFVNGVSAGSWSDSTSYVTARCAINTAGDSLGSFGRDFYMDDFRVTKGVGRYSSNFSPPTSAFPNS